MAVVLASSLVAGYITPLTLLMANLPEALLLAVAFSVGAGAQKILRGVIDRINPPAQTSGGAKP